MGIEIDPDALLLACGEELVPTGTAMQSLRKAASDGRTWMLTFLYFISFGVFVGLSLVAVSLIILLQRQAPVAAKP